jgi:hypothetical protein
MTTYWAGIPKWQEARMLVMALRDADLPGTLLLAQPPITLEPCSTTYTGPCCDTRPARYVASICDPIHLVSGPGIQRGSGLQALGLKSAPALQGNFSIGFLCAIRRDAVGADEDGGSLDGTTARPTERNQWISSPEARVETATHGARLALS